METINYAAVSPAPVLESNMEPESQDQQMGRGWGGEEGMLRLPLLPPGGGAAAHEEV